MPKARRSCARIVAHEIILDRRAIPGATSNRDLNLHQQPEETHRIMPLLLLQVLLRVNCAYAAFDPAFPERASHYPHVLRWFLLLRIDRAFDSELTF